MPLVYLESIQVYPSALNNGLLIEASKCDYSCKNIQKYSLCSLMVYFCGTFDSIIY